MLTRQLIENQIQYTNGEMEKNPVDSYGELYRLWRLWGEEFRGTSMCARHSYPVITVGVGDFAGQSWASPGHVVIVDRLVQDGRPYTWSWGVSQRPGQSLALLHGAGRAGRRGRGFARLHRGADLGVDGSADGWRTARTKNHRVNQK